MYVWCSNCRISLNKTYLYLHLWCGNFEYDFEKHWSAKIFYLPFFKRSIKTLQITFFVSLGTNVNWITLPSMHTTPTLNQHWFWVGYGSWNNVEKWLFSCWINMTPFFHIVHSSCILSLFSILEHSDFIVAFVFLKVIWNEFLVK